MFRVRYNDDQTGTLECPRCGQTLELPGNVHTSKMQMELRGPFPMP
jgi:hypothetical protein